MKRVKRAHDAKERTIVCYQLPCFPNEKPLPGSRLICEVNYGWMGRREYMVFVGGCGCGTFKTEAKALGALPGIVAVHIQREHYKALARLKYASRQFAEWQANREAFRANPLRAVEGAGQ